MTRRKHIAMLTGVVALSAGVRRAPAQSARWSSGTERPSLTVPPNATDCHHHVYDARFPASPSATLRPPDASVEDYRQLQRRLGLTRNVVVQPSTYGTDYRLLVEAGVAVRPAALRVPMLGATPTPPELSRPHD